MSLVTRVPVALGPWSVRRVGVIPILVLAILGALGLPASAWAQEDLVLNFGPANGLWTLSANAVTPWSPLHPLASESVLSADIDGNGQADLVVDFGSAGLWALVNNSQWVMLHNLSPSRVVAGDLDGSGRDDLLVVFPGYGLWEWLNNTTWRQLHAMEPSRIVTGNAVAASAGDEAIIEFPGYGQWWFTNNTTWSVFYSDPVSSIVISNIAGGVADDVVMALPGAGLWVWQDDGALWAPIHPAAGAIRAAGNIDASPENELIVDFGAPDGIWSYSSTVGWLQVHPFPAESIVLADRNGDGRKELLIDFGSAFGLWQRDDVGMWLHLHPLSPVEMTAGWALLGRAIGFSQLPGGAFVAPYTESGMTVSPLSGAWTAASSSVLFRGFNYLAPASSAELEVTQGGLPFTFAGVSVYSSLTPIPWVFTGYRNGAEVYSVTGQVPWLHGRTGRVRNPGAADTIDRLVIRLTQPANTSCPTCGNNALVVDNILLH